MHQYCSFSVCNKVHYIPAKSFKLSLNVISSYAVEVLRPPTRRRTTATVGMNVLISVLSRLGSTILAEWFLLLRVFLFFLTSTSFFIRCTLLHGQRFLLCVSAISRLAAWTDYMSLNMEVVSGSSCCKCAILISSVMFWKAAVNPRWILKTCPGI